MPRLHKDSKPDSDNVYKAATDALNGLLWIDDAQIAKSVIEKIIAAGDEQPRTEIVVSKLY
jgi:Holliday junction resolvase RusA-like endonuclease